MRHQFAHSVGRALLFPLLESVCPVFPTADTVLLSNLVSVLTVAESSQSLEINVFLVQQTAKTAMDNCVLHVRMDSSWSTENADLSVNTHVPLVMQKTHLFVLLVLLGTHSTLRAKPAKLLHVRTTNAKCVLLELSTEVQNVPNALLKTV